MMSMEPEYIPPDPKHVEKVREIMLALANTNSAMKIFPANHATVLNFVEDLAKKIMEFLEANGKLEIDIEEFVFTFMGKSVYKDELSIKSLPFFFFKDGMQKLFFYDGLEKDEIADFLELVKRESHKPAEEADIVTAMWEKDLTNIQYYAPDDYLESKILEERTERQAKAGAPTLPAELAAQVIDVKVDTSQFTKGRIEVAGEGLEEGEEMVLEMAGQEQPRGDGEVPKGGAAAHDATLSDREVEAINTLIHENRASSPEEEFLNLMVELVYLEKDISRFQSNLDVMMDYHVDQLQNGNFQVPILIIHKVQELREFLSEHNPERAGPLEDFLKKVTGEKTTAAIKETFKKNPSVDVTAFFEYLRLLGDQALPLAAEIYEAYPVPEFRVKVLGFLKGLELKDLGPLVNLANDSRPDLSKEIIRLLDEGRDRKAAQHLAVFLSFQNRDIRIEAVHALGRIDDEMADKILAGFLKDRDEELRIQAALKLKYHGDASRILAIIQDASNRSFRRKSLTEKQAIINFLGRSRTDEAFRFLKTLLERPGLLPSAHRIEMRLCAVSGLESMATTAAVEVLRRGTAFRRAKIREACSGALVRMASAPATVGHEERT
jgi:hypothetical protein